MYDVFICYVRTYLDQVTPLHDTLEVALRNIYQRGSQVFQDTSDLQVGNRWESEVNTALEQARVMVVVVVPTILESPQCRREILNFADTPGKHLVPLICERDSRLERLAATVDDHAEGSEDHEIAVCARALREWQEYDFSHAVYQNPNESGYKIAVAELARMIRNKLEHEDRAARGSETPEPAPAETPDPQAAEPQQPPIRNAAKAGQTSVRDDPEERSAAAAEGPQASDGSGRRRRRAPIVAGVAAVVIAAGLGVWTFVAPPSEPESRFTKEQAFDLLDRALINATGDVDYLRYDPESRTLRIAAPPAGTARVSIALQPAMDPLLQAGLVPAFTDMGTDGDACLKIGGDPLMLESNDLMNGAVVTVRLTIVEQAQPANQAVCLPSESIWQLVDASFAEVNSGVMFDAPSDDAEALRRLRSGQSVQGPFWTSDDVPGWIRVEYRGEYLYFRRDLVRDPE